MLPERREASLLESLREQTESRAIEVEDLRPLTIPADAEEVVAGEKLVAHLASDDHGQRSLSLLASAAASPADTALLLVAAALGLLMTPVLALFYGGLVRSKNILDTMMMSVSALGVAVLVRAGVGYSIAFAEGNGVLGGMQHLLLGGVGLEAKGSVPHLRFMADQATFAIITVALISGAVVEPMSVRAYLLLMGLWVAVVYSPVARWVWGRGWLGRLGALDFAGGTVVHVTAGAAALVAALVVGRRKDHGRQALLPHNVPFALLGAGLLWFGWIGFNAGSALAANGTAAPAFANTQLAPAAALVVWTLLDLRRTGKATSVGSD